MFRTALTALTEPCTLWQRIRRHLSPKRRVVLYTSFAMDIIPCLLFLRRVAVYVTLAAPASRFIYFPSGMWWHICTIRTTGMLHSSSGLQLCSSRLHNAYRCVFLSSADSHITLSHLCLALTFCHLLQYSLRFGYIACRCICFPIIVLYMSDIYCPIFTLSSTMPSVDQQKIFPSGRNGSVRVDALRQSRQRHPGGGLLRARP